MPTSNIKRFALGYTVLVILALAAIFGAYKGFTAKSVSKAEVKAAIEQAKPDLGAKDLLLLACDYATIQAVNQGVAVRKCTLDGKIKFKGDSAEVPIYIKTKVGNFKAKVFFQKSLWTVQDWGVEAA